MGIFVDKSADTCSVWFCTRRVYARRLCAKHYLNLNRYNQPLAPRDIDAKRAVEKTEKIANAVIRYTDQVLAVDENGFSTCPVCDAYSDNGKLEEHRQGCQLGDLESAALEVLGRR